MPRVFVHAPLIGKVVAAAMPTAYIHRLDIIIPTSLVAGVATWWAAEVAAGRLEFDDPTQWQPLNTSGLKTDAVTHRRSCGSYTNAQIKRVLIRVGQLASISLPGNWDTRTLQQKIDWVKSQRVAVRTATGVWLGPCNNETDWDEVAVSLATMGLKPVSPTAP